MFCPFTFAAPHGWLRHVVRWMNRATRSGPGWRDCTENCALWYKGRCALVMIAAALYSRELALPTDKPFDRDEAPGASMQIIDPTAKGKGENI